MRNVVRHIVMAAVTMVMLAAAEECRAQKYPERRTTRQGNKAYNQGDYPAAEVKYRKALVENSELWEADHNLGNAAYKQERYDEAAKTWGRVAQDSLRTPSDKAEALFNVGNAMFSQRKWQEAIDAYKQSLRLVPDDTECKFNLAYAQKMLQHEQQQQQQQQQQQNDQNQDQNQNNDQNQDQNKDQNNDQNQNNEGDNKDDKGNNKQKPEQKPQEQPQGQQPQQQPRISQQQAEQMLQAIQGEEDKTRDKLDKQKAVAVGRSGKNW